MNIIVFIHRSIKTRIETPGTILYIPKDYTVFIHRSIKTRIETRPLCAVNIFNDSFYT